MYLLYCCTSVMYRTHVPAAVRAVRLLYDAVRRCTLLYGQSLLYVLYGRCTALYLCTAGFKVLPRLRKEAVTRAGIRRGQQHILPKELGHFKTCRACIRGVFCAVCVP